PAAYRTQINDVLLAALGVVLAEWTGAGAVAVDLEGHGREDLGADIDVSRTVGWFSTLFPVVIPRYPGPDLGLVLKRAEEQLRRVPRHGLGYGLLRYLGDCGDGAAATLRALPAPEISVNYLGQPDRTRSGAERFRQRAESLGPDRSSAGLRGHLVELDARVSG